jgi:hypothetical protein
MGRPIQRLTGAARLAAIAAAREWRERNRDRFDAMFGAGDCPRCNQVSA